MSSSHLSDAGPKAARARQLLLWACLVGALLIGFAIDGTVMAAVRPLHHSDLAGVINNTVRWLGNGRLQIPLLLGLALLGVWLSRPLVRAAGWGLLAFVASGAAANVLKVLIHRPRPWVTAPPPETWWGYVEMGEFRSFPSGDASTTFAIATVFAIWYPWLRVPLAATATAVAVGRVLVGSHHPSDVAAGAMLGVGVGQLVMALARRRGRSGREATG
jgi:undecaprenyl-diphosphatase